MKVEDAGKIYGIIFVVGLLMIISPLLIIWALNTLFGLGVAYTVSTWFATLVLAGTVSGAKK